MDAQAASYAGFWKRFLALVIDTLILSVVNFFMLVPALGLVGLGFFASATSEDSNLGSGFLLAALGAYFFGILLISILGWLYYALMESSARGATLGKMALGIKVTDMNGNRITFGRATGRYFGKIISSMIMLVGYIMAAFTEKKQALHDLIAGCLVVNN